MAGADPELAAVTVIAPPPREATGAGRLARQGVASLAGAAVTAVCGLLVTLVVARGLDADSAGVFFAVTSLFLLLLGIASLGTPTGLVYWLSRAGALGRPERRSALLRAGLVPVSVVSSAGAVALWMLVPWLGDLVLPGADPAVRAEFDVAVRALSLCLPAAALHEAVTAATRGLGSARTTIVVERVVRPAAQLLAVIGVVALAAQSPAVVAVAWVLPYLPALWLTATVLRRLPADPAHASALPDGPVEGPGAFWRYTGPRALATLGQAVLQRLDILLVAGLRGPVEAAVYTAATRFLVVGQLGAQSISLVAEPVLGGILATGDTARARGMYRMTTTWLVLCTWPLYLTAMVLAPELVGLFGPGYASGAVVVVVLSATMLVATACGMVDVVLAMAGRTTWNLGNVLAAVAVNVTVDLWLIPEHGILGAAVGWAAAILTKNLLALGESAVALGLHPWGRSLGLAVLLATGCFGVLPWSVAALADGTPARFAAVAAGAALFAAGAWRCRAALELEVLRLDLRARLGRRADVR